MKGILAGAAIGMFIGGVIATLGIRGDSLLWLGAITGSLIAWLLSRPGTDLAARLRSIEERLDRIEAAPQSVEGAAAPATAPHEASSLATAIGTENHTRSAVSLATDARTERPPHPSPIGVDAWTGSSTAPSPADDAPTPQTDRPPSPAAPSLLMRGWNIALDWLTGGNTIVRVGILLLFVGIGLLVKYASDHALLPVELRLVASAALGVALLALGWRLRKTRPGYGLSLQGGGVGILYLTTFGALRLFGLIAPVPAFVVLALLVILAAILAVAQNSLALAVLGAAGGFLAPILASTGAGSHVALFTYYAILNIGIFAVAAFRAWRPLNVLGFAFTFVIGAAWGVMSYDPQHYATTQPFLLLFFALYLTIGWLVARRRAAFALRDYVDGTLTFGVPIAAFSLQYALVREIPFGAAFSALGFGAIYLLLAALLWRRQHTTLRLLTESWLALGIGFLTLAVPLALSGSWIAVTWALEGAALLWIGLRQQRWTSWLAGITLQGFAGAAFLVTARPLAEPASVLNPSLLGALLLALAGLFSAWYWQRAALTSTHPATIHARLATWPWSGMLLAWGAAWWYSGGIAEIGRQTFDPALRLHVGLLFIALSALCCSWLAKRLRWNAFAVAAAVLPLTLILGGGIYLESVRHPAPQLGWLAWPIALAAHYWLLWRHRFRLAQLPGWLTGLGHAIGPLLVAGLAAWETGWQMSRLVPESHAWWWAALALPPLAMLWWLTTRGQRWLPWPIARYPMAYHLGAGLPLALTLLVWLLVANWRSDGNASPLPSLPLLNPLDIASLLVLATLLRSGLEIGRRAEPWFAPPQWGVSALIGFAGFYWANAALLRGLHQLAGIPYRWHDLWHSLLVQMSFSLFWTTLALTAMVLAVRLGRRTLWFAGAALLGLTVVKLLALDLSSLSGMTRIASFIGVGLLMLAVGFFAPLPPARTANPPMKQSS